MSQPLAVASDNVEGNIGSCALSKEVAMIDLFHSENMVVNSCTGEIVATHQYFDPAAVYFPLLFLFVVVVIRWALRDQ